MPFWKDEHNYQNPNAWKSSRPKSWPPGWEERPVEIPELDWRYVKPEYESMQNDENTSKPELS